MKLFCMISTVLTLTLTLVAIAVANSDTAEPNMCIAPATSVDAATTFTPDDAPIPVATRCWKCSSDSDGSCSDKYCDGERADCLKKGCKITGSISQCGSKPTC